MSLLSPAESLAFNGFLSSVDYGDVLDSEWSTLTSQLAPPRGKEALAKATKDLISLEPQPQPSASTSTHDSAVGSPSDIPSPSSPSSPRSASPSPRSSAAKSQKMQVVTATAAASSSATVNGWPMFASPTEQIHQHQHQSHHRYTYGFGVPSHLRSDPSSSAQRLPAIYTNPFDPAVQGHGHSPLSLPLPYPHAHSESSLRHRAGSLQSQPSPLSAHFDDHGFILPPLTDHAQLQQMHQSPTSYSPQSESFLHRPSQHPGITSTTSAPSVLLQRRPSTKRSHPTDNGDSDASSSNTTSTIKRQRRPSTTPSLDSGTPEAQNGSASSSAAAAAQRQALLSPSQKRANHIQSEQKRRANIRRGYEALCEVVPTLREAIKAEEESLAAAEEEKANSKSRGGGRKKGKAKAKEEFGPGGVDGRAGPRSENVVLSQTIDYLQGLLSERDSLLQRLAFARSTLTTHNSTHPALNVSPTAASSDGVALWEREWGGGTGWGAEEGEEE